MKVTSLVLFVALGGGHFSWGKTPQRNRNRIKKRMRPGRRSRGERNRNQHNDDEHVNIEHVGHEYADDHYLKKTKAPTESLVCEAGSGNGKGSGKGKRPGNYYQDVSERPATAYLQTYCVFGVDLSHF